MIKGIIEDSWLRSKWRAREENLPPRWPETLMILPPIGSSGKSNVRPKVRPTLRMAIETPSSPSSNTYYQLGTGFV